MLLDVGCKAQNNRTQGLKTKYFPSPLLPPPPSVHYAFRFLPPSLTTYRPLLPSLTMYYRSRMPPPHQVRHIKSILGKSCVLHRTLGLRSQSYVTTM